MSRNITLAMLASVAFLSTPAMAWESANDGGRLRYFTNTIDVVNMRAWPAPVSQIVARLPRDSQMSADRCIHPEGLQHDWCHVKSGSSTGWVDAAYLRETGRGEAGVYHVSSTVSKGVLNLRTGPSVNNAIVIPIPAGTTVQVSRCIPPSSGSTAPWCETTYNGYHGWASTAGMYPDNNSSPGYAYAGRPMPAVMPMQQAIAPAAPVAPSAPPSLYQGTLPKCDDADIIMKVVKLSLGFAGGITDYLILGDAHALSINNIDGSKVCVANFRADLEKARAAETWIMSGPHPLTQMAAKINHEYDMAQPMHVTFSIRPDGEGGYTFRPLNQ
jgi:uncharacterized protein YraI